MVNKPRYSVINETACTRNDSYVRWRLEHLAHNDIDFFFFSFANDGHYSVKEDTKTNFSAEVK